MTGLNENILYLFTEQNKQCRKSKNVLHKQ